MKTFSPLLLLPVLLAIAACGNSPSATAEAPAPRAPGVPVDPASLAVANPLSYQPASSADIRSGRLAALLADLESACTTNDATLFYSLFSERVRQRYSGATQAQVDAKFADVCRARPDFMATLADGATISPNPFQPLDGELVSNLCPRNSNGVCAGGMDVGIERGMLKFEEL